MLQHNFSSVYIQLTCVRIPFPQCSLILYLNIMYSNKTGPNLFSSIPKEIYIYDYVIYSRVIAKLVRSTVSSTTHIYILLTAPMYPTNFLLRNHDTPTNYRWPLPSYCGDFTQLSFGGGFFSCGS